MSKHRLVVAWIEMAVAVAVFLALIGLDLSRQSVRNHGTIGPSLLFTAILVSPLLFGAAQRLRRTLTGQDEERAYPPTLAGAIGVAVISLALIAALAPFLIRL
jgi:hypothetical protein